MNQASKVNKTLHRQTCSFNQPDLLLIQNDQAGGQQNPTIDIAVLMLNG
jgi:hypothetical protein